MEQNFLTEGQKQKQREQKKPLEILPINKVRKQLQLQTGTFGKERHLMARRNRLINRRKKTGKLSQGGKSQSRIYQMV